VDEWEEFEEMTEIPDEASNMATASSLPAAPALNGLCCYYHVW
jgi:hypothetical protein